jgi:hypothetical protein
LPLSVVVCSLLAIGAIGFTLLVRERDIPPAPVENPQLKHLENRRQVLYENLKDLQFEYHQGKLSDADYQSLKAGFLYDLAGVMDSIERLQPAKGVAHGASHGSGQGPDGKTAADAGAKKKPKSAPAPAAGQIACPACGAANTLGNRFCGQCAKALGH